MRGFISGWIFRTLFLFGVVVAGAAIVKCAPAITGTCALCYGRRVRTKIKTIRVRVTEADIAQGIPRDGLMCPVSLAVRRALGGHLRVFTHTRVSVSEPAPGGYFGRRLWQGMAPESARAWLIAFDAQADPMSPIEFDLTFEWQGE